MAALLFASVPAYAAAPRFNGDNVSAGIPTFNAIFWGAKCDGTSDDTNAINAAVTAAGSNGIVLLPNGTCRNLTGSISLKSGVYLRGSGQGATTLEPAANSTYATITWAASASNSGVSDLSINGNATVAGTRTADCIYAENSTSNISVHNVECYAAADNGIEMDGTNEQVYSSYSHGNYTNGIYVIGSSNASPASNIKVHDNVVINNSVGNTTWDGIDVDPNSKLVDVYNNYVSGNDIIVYETGASGASSEISVVNNTDVNSTENGIALGGELNDITVKGNRVYTPTGYCIYDNTKGLTSFRLVIDSNYCIGPTKHGIYIANFNNLSSGGPTDVDILNNHIENVGSTYAGIFVTSASTSVQIRGNTIIPNSGAYAIDTTGAAAGVTLSGNYAVAGGTGTYNTASGQTLAAVTLPAPGTANKWSLNADGSNNLGAFYNGSYEFAVTSTGTVNVYQNLSMIATGNNVISSSSSGATIPFIFNAPSSPTGDFLNLRQNNSNIFRVTSTGGVIPLFVGQSANCANIACRATMTNGSYTWTFANAYANIPVCTASEEGSNGPIKSVAPSTSAVTVTSSTTTGNGDTVDIHCSASTT